MDIIQSLLWRYATKKFDPEKKISESDIKTVAESLRLTASSLGMQPWKFIIIGDPKLKETLLPATKNQPQAVESSHLIVLCRKTSITDTDIQAHIQQTAEARKLSLESLEGYKTLIHDLLITGERSKRIDQWARNQVYLALGNLMTTCAVMKIDTCAIGGFDPAQYDRILNLKEQGLASVVVCALGYRSSEDKYATLPKVRFLMEDMVELIK